MQKHEWRKHEKALYLPKARPEVVQVPEMQFVSISGEGNPNHPDFGSYIEALYAVAYAVKMTLKKSTAPPAGYRDYTVYPLEGVWDLKESARGNTAGNFDKNDLVFTLMIRQPDYVSDDFFAEMRAMARQKKDNPLIEAVQFGTFTEGKCVQMLHRGSYDDEPATFAVMEEFAAQNGLSRLSKRHREIYLSDFRRTAVEKLKTVLRFRVA